MPLSLGDFFASAPYARAVNPRPVTFTADAKGEILPGGHRNPSPGKQVSATVTGCLVFIGGEGTQAAHLAARKHLREKADGNATEGDFGIELTYQLVFRALREYDADAKQAGKPMFESIQVLRELVEFREADRLLAEYHRYVDDEHPEVIDTKTFRGAQGGGA